MGGYAVSGRAGRLSKNSGPLGYGLPSALLILRPMPFMRALRVRGLSLVAMLLLLLGTAAPALARMTCVKSGHSVLNFGQLEDCCPADGIGQLQTIDATCCETGTAQPLRADFTATVHVAAPAAPACLLLWPVAVPAVPTATTGDLAALLEGLPPVPLATQLASIRVYRL